MSKYFILTCLLFRFISFLILLAVCQYYNRGIYSEEFSFELLLYSEKKEKYKKYKKKNKPKKTNKQKNTYDDRESNPGHLLGWQLCSPLHHQCRQNIWVLNYIFVPNFKLPLGI